MWEFSITLQSKHSLVAAEMFDSLRRDLGKFHAIVAESQDENFLNIIIAVDEKYKSDAQIVLLRVIALTICQNFKSQYLDTHLFLPMQDEISLYAFKKALINFDKKTDYFIISKALNFDEFLFLESFYNFKLSLLRDKWRELVCLANENRDYFVSQDAFLELLKFLIDNIDICSDEIDVVEEEQGYCIVSGGEKGAILSARSMVGSLIDLSPQKINMYCKGENKVSGLLRSIFSNRLNLRKNEICEKK